MNKPVAVVERQLDAYNSHDLQAFVNTYAVDVRIDRRDGSRITGREALRDAYADQFSAGRCRAEIIARMTEGDWVIDHEVAHGLADEPIRVLVAYRVHDGLINRVHFFA
ncbi:nuclear transport factor 2 family protein [Micromonospora sp. WMMA1363]|uniref:nuclear transport factor 2 family protein n=1 Tax=Micromonospora sp. WMMA1363 TaxID=3053985 RepID=UPI00259D0C55|nr:nuclear transport factor 2 family protein [Micromonospora sp. WMMA1363]MDM4722387.1 nuclear transport factor 2 family protein [Micromonospora sp. WMMA1363]